MSGATGEESLAIIQRWEDSGGTWRLVSHDGNGWSSCCSPAPAAR